MKLNKLSFTALAVLALVAQPFYAVMVGKAAYAAGETVTITNAAELRTAIENQDDDQVWNIQAGNYAVTPTSAITAGGQTGWYFPIVKNNITINGVGNPTIYGSSYTPNGAWATQNLVSVFGDNVTINGLTLMPKVQPNKTLEVLGNNFTLQNTVFTPNTLVDSSVYDNIANVSTREWAKQWGGSLYFNHEGAHTITNVTINNGGVSYRYTPSGTTIALNNVQIVNATNDSSINGYRYSSGFNNPGNTVNGAIQVIYRVSSVLNNLNSVLAAMQNGDIIELDSDLVLSQQLTLNKSVLFDGKGHTITAGFTKTDNSNNSAIGVQANGVTIKDVVLDGVDPAARQLHGINAYMVSGLVVDGVTAKNFRTGILYNGSTGVIQNVHTIGNIWHGINIDKDGANVQVLGTNTHTETLNIYVDDATKDVTVYAPAYDYHHPGIDGRTNDRVYTLKPVVVDEEDDEDEAVVPGSGTTGNGEIPATRNTSSASSANDESIVAVASDADDKAADTKKSEVLGTDQAKDTLSAQDSKKEWSLVNVLLAAAAAVLSIITLAGIRGSEGRARQLRLLTIVPAVIAIIAVLMVEDFTASLGWINGWTLLFAAIAIAQVALMASVKPVEDK